MSTQEHKPTVEVLVAGDNAFVRNALCQMIESEQSFHIVGTAETGLEAVEKVARLQPDVVALDVEMPSFTSLETLKQIMRESPRPVILVNSLGDQGWETEHEALELGAFDCVSRRVPSTAIEMTWVREDLVHKIKAAAQASVSPPRWPQPAERPAHLTTTPAVCPVPAIVAIGVSTGGPTALEEMLPKLPRDLPVAMLVVQHMPAGFTAPFAKRLNSLSKVAVLEANDGMPVKRGHVYIAPAGMHMTVRRLCSCGEVLHLSTAPNTTQHRPSVDVMMFSVADTYHARAMGIIMTGMGADGALGMQAIFHAGGMTVGQDEASCAVYGMPRSCAEMGILRRVAPLADIPGQILSAVQYYKPH